MTARAAIRARGLRATPARVAVLDAVSGSVPALSHADVSALVAAVHDRTTIFRALDALSRVGLVRKVDAGDRVWRYKRSPSSNASFLCTRCGVVLDLPGVTLAGAALPKVIARGEVEIVVRGACDDCCGRVAPATQ